jgi:hypothetical protein
MTSSPHATLRLIRVNCKAGRKNLAQSLFFPVFMLAKAPAPGELGGF